jgi:hypothetical protein
MKECTRPIEGGIETGATTDAILSLNTSNAQAQRDYILRTLARGSITTQQLRDAGVMHPAGRIKELRQGSWNILTTMESVYDHVGIKHGRVARYHLVREA